MNMAVMPPPQADPMMMLQQMLKGGVGQGAQQPDPRAGAIEQFMAQQGQQSNMPVRPPQMQIDQSMHANPDAQMTDQGDYPDDGDDDDTSGQGGQQAPYEGQPEYGSDEKMLANVHDQMDTPRSIEDLDPKEHDVEYLRTLPPRAQRAYLDSIDQNDERPGEGPATDSDYEAAYGKGASERSMGGQPPYDRGFLKENDQDQGPYFRSRRPNMPADRRFPEQMDPYGDEAGRQDPNIFRRNR